MSHIFIIHLYLRTFRLFPLLAIVNRVAGNIAESYLQTEMWNRETFGCLRRSCIVGSYGIFILSFITKITLLSRVSHSICNPINSRWRWFIVKESIKVSELFFLHIILLCWIWDKMSNCWLNLGRSKLSLSYMMLLSHKLKGQVCLRICGTLLPSYCSQPSFGPDKASLNGDSCVLRTYFPHNGLINSFKCLLHSVLSLFI